MRRVPRALSIFAVGTAMLLALMVATGCSLIPVRETACSASRPCPEGMRCDPDTSVCVDVPPSEDAPDLRPIECVGPCIPCKVHADCPSQVCNAYPATTQGGTCVPAGEIVYVDNRNGTCVRGTGDGESPLTALCNLDEALDRVDGVRKRAVRLMASIKDYGPITLQDRAVTLYGPAGQGGRAQLGNRSDMDGVTVSGAAQVVIDGLEITRGRVGVNCMGDGSTRITLRRSRVTSTMDIGVLATDCTLEIDRTLLYSNGNGALVIGGAQGYAITNSFITRNRSPALPAVKIATSGPGVFRFNTVADNATKLGGAIDCGEQDLEISDSIVVKNITMSFSQFKGGCKVRNTVVGGFDNVPGGIKSTPEFMRVEDIDYGLRPDRAAMCIDKARGCLATDFFGTRRPVGGLCDIGAHEVQ
jgi:hypothetical protein